MSLRTLSRSVCAGVVFLFLVVVEVRSVDLDDGPATHGYPKTWLAKIFYETLADFTGPTDVGSSACREQMQMYVRHLQNESLWAVQSQYNILYIITVLSIYGIIKYTN